MTSRNLPALGARVLQRAVLLVALCACGTTIERAGDDAAPLGPDPGVPPQVASCDAKKLLGAPNAVVPVWCQNLGSGAGTSVSSPNTWRDDFNHGLSFASIDNSYVIFDRAPAFSSSCHARHFRHNDHWMADLGTNGCDGVLMRPNADFRFDSGKLVVEATVAAGIDEYGPHVWPEIVVSTAPAPTALSNGDLYAYTMFPGSWSFGCRLQSGRVPICALFDNTGRGTQAGGRLFELSFFQHENAANVYGGEPGPRGGDRDRAWRVCIDTDPDISCRDRFRLELSDRDVKLYVNNVLYMAHIGLPNGKRLPDAMTKGKLYVYFASWSWRLNEVANGARFHWDDLTVNPR